MSFLPVKTISALGFKSLTVSNCLYGNHWCKT